MSATSSDLGQLVRQFRVRAGLSQNELADRSGVSARAVSDLERGLRRSARLETLRMLADALRLTAAEREHLFSIGRPSLMGESTETSAQQRDPPTTLQLVIRPLPVYPDALVGREADEQIIQGLLQSRQTRLVTLTGPAGVGKTRLGLEVGLKRRSRYIDGVAWVDLSSLATAHQVAQAIVSAVELDTAGLGSLEGPLLATLRERDLLLILDNFEHVLDAAPLIGNLLAGCPELSILVTSRVRLHVRGEQVYPVSPLKVLDRWKSDSLPEVEDLLSVPSIRLFDNRARQANYDFVLDENNAEAIADICRQLDGLPLAIELAASRVGMLAPSQLLRRLSEPTRDLRGAPERQRTLANAIAWSYNLLDQDAQTIYRRLSVFSGGFTLEAAEAVVAGDGIDVVGAIATLLESSLLSRMPGNETSRFTMLNTISRDAAVRLVESKEFDHVRDRHSHWMSALLAASDVDLRQGRMVSTWFGQLDAELGNLRAAVDFLTSMGERDRLTQLLAESPIYCLNRLSAQEASQWISAALDLSQDPPSAERLVLLSSWLIFATILDDHNTARHVMSVLRGWTDRIDDEFAKGVSNFVQGNYVQIIEDYAQSERHHQQALGQFQQVGAPAWIHITMFELGTVWFLTGQTEAGRRMIEEGIRLNRETESSTELAYGLLYYGLTTLGWNNAVAARAFNEGVVLASALRLDRLALAAMSGLAGVAMEMGDAPTAARLFGAIDSARQIAVPAVGIMTVLTKMQQQVINLLGIQEYERFWQEGVGLSYSEAVDLALQTAASARRPNDEGSPS